MEKIRIEKDKTEVIILDRNNFKDIEEYFLSLESKSK